MIGIMAQRWSGYLTVAAAFRVAKVRRKLERDLQVR